jgi:glucose-1-phosphatase
VLWDVGGVLMDVDPVWSGASWMRHTGLPPETFGEWVLASGVKYEMEIGGLTPDQALAKVNELAGQVIGREAFETSLAAMLRFKPEVVQVVAQLAGRVTQGILSNIDPVHTALLEADPTISKTIDTKTYSYEVGALKPDAAPYRAALAKWDFSPQAVLYIDDLPENVEAACALGMVGVHMQGVEQLRERLRERGLLV